MSSNDHGLIKRLVFKLVKKHIAGSTAASVIRTVKQLNDKNVSTTITFLNENAATPLKVRYNINSYSEIIRQFSRLNLNADISLRLSQLGYLYGKEQAIKALDEVVSVASKYNKRIWIESESAIVQSSLFDIKDRYDGNGLIGVEVPMDYVYKYTNGSIPDSMLTYKNIKLMASNGQPQTKGKDQSKPKKIDQNGIYYKCISKLSESGIDTTVFSHDEKMLANLIAESKNYKKHLRFEVPLGYNRKRFGMMLKSNQKMSVYVAYGKDWVPYAINKLTEGRIKDIAKAVLEGEGD
ncbi:MAG: hypothetical protein M1544_03320 [Candidatus Marsarchaeota archaeon]|nr:hypothetical protein [Candidatus Marsarchaeota archaeon]